MKKLFGTIYFLVLITVINAQQSTFSIKGKIIDSESKQPIAGATICINKTCTTSQATGDFLMPTKYEKGSYNLTITSIGFIKKIENIALNQNAIIEVFLTKAEEKLLENLEVTSIRANSSSPFTKTNLNKEEIALQNQGQDIPFVLNQTPNAVINSDAGNGVGYTGIRIRGVDATRINVTVNGIPFNDAESQGTFFVNMPDMLSSTNSMQIQRGVGTSSNGTGAFGATINLSTNELNKTAGAEINNSIGSFNTFKHTLKANSGLIDNKFLIDARLSQITSDGYIDRASSKLQAFALSATYLMKKSSLKFNIFSGKEKTYQAWNGIDEQTLLSNRTFNPSGTNKPGTPYHNETDNYNQTHYQLFYNTTLNDYWQMNITTFLTRGFGYYENYLSNRNYSSFGISSTINGDLVRQLWLDNHFYGNLFSLQHKKNNTTLTIGGSWSNYNGKHFGRIIWSDKGGFAPNHTFYDLKANKWERSLYTKIQQNLKSGLTLYADVQYRFVEHDMPGFRNNTNLFVNRKFNFINPKMGLNYEKNNSKTYLSYAMASKEPNRDDFEAELNNQPKAEHLHNFELGFETKTKKYGFSVNSYAMLYKDQLIPTGKINDVGAYTRVNVDRSYRIGLEFQTWYKINNWISLTADLALSQNRIKSFIQFTDEYDVNWNYLGQKQDTFNNSTIAFSPSIVSSQQLKFDFTKYLSLTLIGKYVGKQYLDNTNNENRILNDFFTLDTRVVYQLQNKLFKQTTLIVTVNNLFNRLYTPNGYTFGAYNNGVLNNYNYFFPAATTNFLFSCNIGL